MPGKRKRGAGWEDEMAAARQRADTAEEDKRVADAIRTAAAADAKKRTGGSMRRKRCKMCGSLPKKGRGLADEINNWHVEGNYWVNKKTGEKHPYTKPSLKRAGKLGFKIGTWDF